MTDGLHAWIERREHRATRMLPFGLLVMSVGLDVLVDGVDAVDFALVAALAVALLVAQAREAGALDERTRLAREIHDTLAQGLIGIITQLAAAGRLARESEARRSVQALRPQPLEDARLPEALAQVAGASKHASASRVGLTLSYMDDLVTLDVRDDGVGGAKLGVPDRASAVAAAFDRGVLTPGAGR